MTTWWPTEGQSITDWAEEVLHEAYQDFGTVLPQHIKAVCAEWQQDDGVPDETVRAVTSMAVGMLNQFEHRIQHRAKKEA
jgi:hypothetical protein